MPKVQYLGPYERRQLTRRELSEDPLEPLPEGEEEEILTWDKEGDPVELSDDELVRLQALTGGSTWRVEDEPDAIDESSSEPDASSSDSGSEQEAGQPA